MCLQISCVRFILAFFRFLIYLQPTPTTHSSLAKNTYQASNRSRAATGDALLFALSLHVHSLSILKVAVSDLSFAVNFI